MAMTPDSGLGGKVAIVTGGSRGIGRAIVELFSAEGADVTFFYRGQVAAAHEVVAAAQSAGAKVKAEQVDVRDSKACAAAVDCVAERTGRIDILVNNAGVIRDNQLAAMDDEDVSLVLDTNVGGVFNVTRAVVPHMIVQRAGKIINLSSVAGEKGGRGQTNYAASKGAINAFTRALAVELAPRKITVNGEPAHTGQRISFGDRVDVNGKPVRLRIVPPPARIIDFHVRVIADAGEILGVEECAVEGELRGLVAVAKTVRRMADREREGHHLPRRQGLIERINRV